MSYITAHLPELYKDLVQFYYMDSTTDNDIIAAAMSAPLDVVSWLLGFDNEDSSTERAIIDMIDHLLTVAGI